MRRDYWIVDPEARRIECYRVDAGAYAATLELEGDATLAPPDWPDLRRQAAGARPLVTADRRPARRRWRRTAAGV